MFPIFTKTVTEKRNTVLFLAMQGHYTPEQIKTIRKHVNSLMQTENPHNVAILCGSLADITILQSALKNEIPLLCYSKHRFRNGRFHESNHVNLMFNQGKQLNTMYGSENLTALKEAGATWVHGSTHILKMLATVTKIYAFTDSKRDKVIVRAKAYDMASCDKRIIEI